MQPLVKVRGKVLPVDRADVDTDQIIGAQHLKRTERGGLGRFVFEAWRNDPSFVLNDRRRHGAPILGAGPNFGCGSSREHAPWALQDIGIRVVIAPSFADIFRTNCSNVGILCVALPAADVERILARSLAIPEAEVEVDLQRCVVATADGELSFQVDPCVREQLLGGLDPIALTLKEAAAIEAFEGTRPRFRPTTKGAVT